LDVFFRLAKAGFSQKRKTLRNALSGGLGMQPSQVEHFLRKADIDPMRRAESLSLAEWEHVVNSYLD
jgi:16S rRNA (adenine1518-N6/adenine1519-N6)-dimethyltransferase